jgi:LPXTG-motif cell wall-anchored protein
VTILIPEELRSDGRIISIVMVHNGVTYTLYDMDSDPNTITFPTRLFSTYVLAYMDITIMDPPKTGDAATPIGIAVLLGSAGLALVARRRRT